MVGWEQHIMVEESLSLESNQRFQLCLYPRSIVQFGLSFHKATGHWGTEDRPIGRWGVWALFLPHSPERSLRSLNSHSFLLHKGLHHQHFWGTMVPAFYVPGWG